MEDRRFAVLIDSDNISSKYIASIIDEMTKYGIVTYKRIYGDWTSTQNNKWKNELMENSITPIQQFRNTVGKNATDSALIIDAMDILYTRNVDGFCIVSSDGDFTRLASRLRESGMEVIGMGENKTPKSFRAACSVFTDLELLLDESEDETEEGAVSGGKKRNTDNILPQATIENAIIEIISENNNKGKDTGLGEIGSRLQKKYSDFDVRNYGYRLLSTFIEDMDNFKLKKKNSTVIVKIHEDSTLRDEVTNYIIDMVEKSGDGGVELGIIGRKLRNRYPDFNVREFGYSTLSRFISGIKELKINSEDNNSKKVCLYVAR